MVAHNPCRTRRRVILAFALALLLFLLAACSDSPATLAPTPTQDKASVIHPIGGTNVEAAHAQLQTEGARVFLVFVSRDADGVEGTIYWDLAARQIRATTGPDEGIDTRAESCYPACVFVRQEDADSLSTATWVAVLRHEYRHIEQARNNPNMAHDFRGPDGRFTSFAAFQEACADYGINVKASYHAQERLDALRQVLGPGMEGVLDQACQGQVWAYRMLVEQYNNKSANAGAFNALFPPFD